MAMWSEDWSKCAGRHVVILRHPCYAPRPLDLSRPPGACRTCAGGAALAEKGPQAAPFFIKTWPMNWRLPFLAIHMCELCGGVMFLPHRAVSHEQAIRDSRA
jgi:hypothetical protein